MTPKLMLVAALCMAAFFTKKSIAQQDMKTYTGPYTNVYGGAGLGFEYGGIGAQAEYLPSPYLGIFAGAGYNLWDLGFNAGVIGRMFPEKKATPVFTAMYGYNAAIKIRNVYGVPSGQSYYGLTLGAGAELKSGKLKKNKVSLGLRIPFRSTDFENDYKKLKDQGYTFNPDILPIAFSFGYHVAINSKGKGS